MSESMQKLPLIEHIAQILDLSKDSGIDDTFLEKAKPYLDSVACELDITPLQAALFAHVFDASLLNYGHRIGNPLFESLKCSKCKYLEYLNEIDELAKRRYVIKRLSNEEAATYAIPRELVYMLRKGKPFKPESYKNISVAKFFSVMNTFFQSRYNAEMLFVDIMSALDSLVEDNPQLEFIKKINAFNLQILDRNLLLYFCSKFINCHGETVNFERIEKQFADEDDPFVVQEWLINPIKHDHHPLQELELIENANRDGLAFWGEYALTEKARENLLTDFIKKKKTDKDKKEFILAADISEKTMFYNSAEKEKINQLAEYLEQKNFKRITQRLADKGLRQGVACLFSGGPGTGKTETVYQIARRTGRDLMIVEVSQTKSMWVGESEKLIKKVFTRYKELVQDSATAPILFFNEADAIISRRRELTESSRGVDQMENSIQNIILQEMENLEGILIATTNLTQNLDKAFERRFLYKIEFEKPNQEVRMSLWKSMIPELQDTEAATLAEKFEFSGGQIENIVRKRTVEMILSDAPPSLEALMSYCRDEYMIKNETRRVGFVA
jgi:AAA+ superfamily predicted ATPase